MICTFDQRPIKKRRFSLIYKLFVYGSLLDLESAKHVIDDIDLRSYRSANIAGYKITCDVPYLVTTDGWSGHADFLNLRRDSKASLVHGKVLTVNHAQLARLRKREKAYALVEVISEDGEALLAFVSNQPRGGTNPVLEKYIQKILAGASMFDDDFKDKIYEQILPCISGRDLIKGDYLFQENYLNKLTNVEY